MRTVDILVIVEISLDLSNIINIGDVFLFMAPLSVNSKLKKDCREPRQHLHLHINLISKNQLGARKGIYTKHARLPKTITTIMTTNTSTQKNSTERQNQQTWHRYAEPPQTRSSKIPNMSEFTSRHRSRRDASYRINT